MTEDEISATLQSSLDIVQTAQVTCPQCHVQIPIREAVSETLIMPLAEVGISLLFGMLRKKLTQSSPR